MESVSSLAGPEGLAPEPVEGMQRGRGSPAFRGGVFSGVMDQPTHHFHKWVANRLAA